MRSLVASFKNIKAGSNLHESLITAGVDEGLLSDFLRSDRTYKSPHDISVASTLRSVSSLVERGGVIAGGAAVKSWLMMGGVRDFDIFFNDFPAYVQAVLETRQDSRIDICLFEKFPYEFFDLTPAMVAIFKSGFDVAPECEEAFKTGVGDIKLDAIFMPVATLRRVAKYGKNYGVKFTASRIIHVAARYGVRQDVVDEAMKYIV